MISIKEKFGFYYIDGKQVVAPALSHSYQTAEPFPHIVIDNFLPELFLDQVIAHFPSSEEATVSHKSGTQYLKRGYRPQKLNGNPCIHYLAVLNSAPIVDYLQQLTGIHGLIPDPFYEGGGLHETDPGGMLQIHADFTLHKKLQLERKINMIVFLNKDWKAEYGGALELWDSTMTGKQQEIIPVYNRCVIFNTSATSFHGHPVPVVCPPGLTRRSIALYFYTAPDNHYVLTSETSWQKPQKNFFGKVIQNVKNIIR